MGNVYVTVFVNPDLSAFTNAARKKHDDEQEQEIERDHEQEIESDPEPEHDVESDPEPEHDVD
jgi:hypothetical protein